MHAADLLGHELLDMGLKDEAEQILVPFFATLASKQLLIHSIWCAARCAKRIARQKLFPLIMHETERINLPSLGNELKEFINEVP